MKRDYKILFGLVLLVYITSVLPGPYSQDFDAINSTQNTPCEIDILESQYAYVFQAVDITNSFVCVFTAFEYSPLSTESEDKNAYSDKEHLEYILFESDTSPPCTLS